MCIVTASFAADAGNAAKPQDLTKGGSPDLSQEDWNLGTTGAEGWTWSIPHKSTEGAKQIYVTQIEKGSPAAGVLKVGDVIVGAFGKDFDYDARKEFGNALALAESKKQRGKLELRVWSKGTTRTVTLKIKVMGDYKESSPFKCSKAKRIVDEACNFLKSQGLEHKQSIGSHVNALGLLATGRKQFRPILKAYAKELVTKSKGYSTKPAVSTWDTAYANLFLTEYCLATGDKSALRGIKEYSYALIKGQSKVGTWGHNSSTPVMFPDGPRYGIAPGYGAMNQPTITALISLVLAKKCRVKGKKITKAIERGADFLRYYVDKGSIPYGDHRAWMGGHDDNGKCSSAAVFFDLIGEGDTATYYTKMTLASYEDREEGHTGNYFSFIWGALGANRGGDMAAAAFMKKLRWFYDLERRRGGNFLYQGKPGMANKQNGEHQYVGWDCTGARLLAYSLPLKKLYITGKRGGVVKPIKGELLEEILAFGEPRARKYPAMKTDELMKRLHSYSPIVRHRAAEALKGRPDDVSAALVEMLKSEDRYVRYGAYQGLRYGGRGSVEAGKIIAKNLVTSDDITEKIFAMRSFTSYDSQYGLNKVAKYAVDPLLKLAVQQDPADPTGKLKKELSSVFFRSGAHHKSIFHSVGIENIPQEPMINAIRELLTMTNGRGRGNVGFIYKQLPTEVLDLLWKDIRKASLDLAPSGIMFASDVRVFGLAAMATHGKKEGLGDSVNYLRYQKGHASEIRIKDVLKIIVEEYGPHAKTMIPKLEKIATYFDGGEYNYPIHLSKEKAADVRAAIRQIKAAKTPKHKKLVSIGK